MIWTIIFALAFMASVVAFFSTDYGSGGYYSSILAMICTGATLVCMVGSSICANSFHDRNLAALQAEHDALVYQAENNMYLGDAVGKFNSELVRNQLGHEDPWTSWFYGSYWVEVEPIEFNK